MAAQETLLFNEKNNTSRYTGIKAKKILDNWCTRWSLPYYVDTIYFCVLKINMTKYKESACILDPYSHLNITIKVFLLLVYGMSIPYIIINPFMCKSTVMICPLCT